MTTPPEKVVHNSHTDFLKKTDLVTKTDADLEAADAAEALGRTDGCTTPAHETRKRSGDCARDLAHATVSSQALTQKSHSYAQLSLSSSVRCPPSTPMLPFCSSNFQTTYSCQLSWRHKSGSKVTTGGSQWRLLRQSKPDQRWPGNELSRAIVGRDPACWQAVLR